MGYQATLWAIETIVFSNFWQELFNQLGVSLCMSLAYHLQTDGQIEVFNCCLETYLRCMDGDRHSNWAKWLPLVEWWYNASFHSTIRGLIRFRPSTSRVLFPKGLQGGSGQHHIKGQRREHKEVEVGKRSDEANRKSDKIGSQLQYGWLDLLEASPLPSTFDENTTKTKVATYVFWVISVAGLNRSYRVQVGPLKYDAHPLDHSSIAAEASSR